MKIYRIVKHTEVEHLASESMARERVRILSSKQDGNSIKSKYTCEVVEANIQLLDTKVRHATGPEKDRRTLKLMMPDPKLGYYKSMVLLGSLADEYIEKALVDLNPTRFEYVTEENS